MVVDVSTGFEVGRFLKPETELEKTNGETLEEVSRTIDATRAEMSWRSSRGYEITATYEIVPDPERVQVNVAARNVTEEPKLTSVYFPFDIKSPTDFPLGYNFTTFNGSPVPPEVILPGEGLTAFWGARDFNLVHTNLEMYLPIAATTTEMGQVIVGCPVETAFAFSIHRSGRIELSRRFFLSRGQDSTDSSLPGTSGLEDAEHSYYIGWTQGLRWFDIYHDWFLKMNPERLQSPAFELPKGRLSTTMPDSPEVGIRIREKGTGSAPAGFVWEQDDAIRQKAEVNFPDGLFPFLLVEQVAPVAEAGNVREEMDSGSVRDSLILTRSGETVPEDYGKKALLSPRFSFGKKLIEAVEESAEDGLFKGVVVDMSRDRGMATRSHPYAGFPFLTFNQSDGEFVNRLSESMRELKIPTILNLPHPANPALEKADALSADTASILWKGIAGRKPVYCSSKDEDHSGQECAFFGMVCAIDGNSERAAVNLRFSEAVSNSVIVGGDGFSQIEYLSDSGEIFTALRNLTEDSRDIDIRFENPRLSIKTDTSYRIIRWRWDAEGVVHATNVTGEELKTSVFSETLEPEEIAFIAAIPVNISTNREYLRP